MQLSILQRENGVNHNLYIFFPLSCSEVTLAGWAPGRDPSGRQTAGRGTQSCCPSQPTGRLTGPKACQTDTTPGRAGGRKGAGEGAGEGCTEVEVGIGDNQYPMHLSISYSMEDRKRTVSGVPLCPLLAYDQGCLRWQRDREREIEMDSYYSAYNRKIAIHTIRSSDSFVVESGKRKIWLIKKSHVLSVKNEKMRWEWKKKDKGEWKTSCVCPSMCLRVGATLRASQACPEHEPSTSTTFKHTLAHKHTHTPIQAHLSFPSLTWHMHTLNAQQCTCKLLPCNYKVHAKSHWTCTFSSAVRAGPRTWTKWFSLAVRTQTSLFNKMSSSQN